MERQLLKPCGAVLLYHCPSALVRGLDNTICRTFGNVCHYKTTMIRMHSGPCSDFGDECITVQHCIPRTPNSNSNWRATRRGHVNMDECSWKWYDPISKCTSCFVLHTADGFRMMKLRTRDGIKTNDVNKST